MRSSLVLVATAAVSLSVNALAQNTFSPITPPGGGAPTYVDMMRANTQALVRAVAGRP